MPTFVGTPTLGVVQAIGSVLVVDCLITRQPRYFGLDGGDSDSGMKITKAIILTIMKPAVTLFFGWIVHLFM